MEVFTHVVKICQKDQWYRQQKLAETRLYPTRIASQIHGLGLAKMWLGLVFFRFILNALKERNYEQFVFDFVVSSLGPTVQRFNRSLYETFVKFYVNLNVTTR